MQKKIIKNWLIVALILAIALLVILFYNSKSVVKKESKTYVNYIINNYNYNVKIEQVIQQKEQVNDEVLDLALNKSYVELSRIEELKSIKNSDYDLAKLIEYCEGLNKAYSNQSHLAVANLVRAIMDHVPPIFEQPNFRTLASQSPRSEKDIFQALENTSRKIADYHLHNPISNKEHLPTATQVDSKKEIDFLLGVIIKKLSVV